MPYPKAPRLPVVDRIGDREIADPYRWLEDPHDPHTIEWSAAEDALTRPFLDGLPGRPQLAERLRALLRTGREGVPFPRGDVGFRGRRAPEQQHGVIVVGPLDDPASFTVLVDPQALDPSGATTLDAWSPSPDGRLLAYQISVGGDEESAVYILDVASGQVIEGPLDRTRYSPIAWLPDGSGFYYVRRLRPDSPFDRRVYLHALGTAPDEDLLVFGEGSDPRTYFDVDLSRDGRWLVVSAAVGTAPRDDVWIADLHSSGELKVVAHGVDARCGAAVGFDGRLYIVTDADAPRGQLCVADPLEPQVWTTLIPEDPEAVFGGYVLLDDEILVARHRHAISEVVGFDRETGAFRRQVPLPGIGTVQGLTAAEDGGARGWIEYTDSVTPPTVLDHDGGLWASAPGTVSLPPISATLEVCTSADGTPIHVQVLAPGDAAELGPLPTVLYGYGGFGISVEPAYTAAALAWVESGGVWAVAQLRGGGEEGEAWHRAGMRESKRNVFADFEAAARHLRATGRASKIGIFGGSNGGLLVGAAVTREPALYDAVICSAPLLDMVRYERFGLGSTWNDEYGTAADPEELGWLLSYSPLHAVRPGTSYPPVLLEVFDSDTRVDPMHARKFAAALQWAAETGGNGVALLRREFDVGHGSRSIDRSVALTVDNLSFLARHLGLTIDTAQFG